MFIIDALVLHSFVASPLVGFDGGSSCWEHHRLLDGSSGDAGKAIVRAPAGAGGGNGGGVAARVRGGGHHRRPALGAVRHGGAGERQGHGEGCCRGLGVVRGWVVRRGEGYHRRHLLRWRCRHCSRRRRGGRGMIAEGLHVHVLPLLVVLRGLAMLVVLVVVVAMRADGTGQREATGLTVLLLSLVHLPVVLLLGGGAVGGSHGGVPAGLWILLTVVGMVVVSRGGGGAGRRKQTAGIGQGVLVPRVGWTTGAIPRRWGLGRSSGTSTRGTSQVGRRGEGVRRRVVVGRCWRLWNRHGGRVRRPELLLHGQRLEASKRAAAVLAADLVLGVVGQDGQSLVEHGIVGLGGCGMVRHRGRGRSRGRGGVHVFLCRPLLDFVGLLGSSDRYLLVIAVILAILAVVLVIVDEAQPGTKVGDGIERQRCGLVHCGSLDLLLLLLIYLLNPNLFLNHLGIGKEDAIVVDQTGLPGALAPVVLGVGLGLPLPAGLRLGLLDLSPNLGGEAGAGLVVVAVVAVGFLITYLGNGRARGEG